MECLTCLSSSHAYKQQTGLERLARYEHSSLLRKFVNYKRKNIYNFDPLADIWDSRSENIFPNSSATAEEVTCNQFHKHFMLLTYGRTKISCSCTVIHWRHHVPMQCFQHYFDTAVSYTCKMFMKSTPGSRNFMKCNFLSLALWT
jgi:hypothetical protein